MSADNGETWQNLTLNLPNVPVYKILYISEYDKLLIGNLYGIYEYENREWGKIEALPVVAVTNLQYSKANNSLYIATYGRGIWKCKIK
jgi:hypothetical protein